MTDAAWFREQFPVFERVSFMNAGSEGPIPRVAGEAARERIRSEVERGRGGRPYFEEVLELAASLRSRCAALVGCEIEELALTGSTTDGVNAIVGGFNWRRGDEILTTDEEHPGVLAPLASARRRYGVTIRVVPWDEIAGAASEATRLIACSHVSWMSGRVIDTDALAATGVPVLLDGAQALGAIPVDVRTLGCDFYAAPGQKWLCGPTGSGSLFIRRERIDELQTAWLGFASLADHEHPLESALAEGAARFDVGFPTGLRSSWALASLDLLQEAGWEWIHTRGPELAARLADLLAGREVGVMPRGRTTLVSWRAADAEAVVERLREHRIVVRQLPGRQLVRASVGAWSNEDEVARLSELAVV